MRKKWMLEVQSETKRCGGLQKGTSCSQDTTSNGARVAQGAPESTAVERRPTLIHHCPDMVRVLKFFGAELLIPSLSHALRKL